MPRVGLILQGLPAAPARRARIVLVDNYDSFTLNLAHLLAQLGVDVSIVRNDAVPVPAVMGARPVGVVLSPGPLTPRQAGICVPLVRACARAEPSIPLLGVCLGHQAVGVAFGGRIARAEEPVHGRSTEVFHRGGGLLRGLRSPFAAARYHSLVVSDRGLPACLAVTARSARGEILALRHRRLPIEGLQFHPESYLTPDGPRILAAFLRRCGLRARDPRTVVR